MNEKKPVKDGRGNVRYLWVLVGAYLLYLAYQQLQLFLRGEVTKTVDVVVCSVSGVVFAAVGAWVIYREWQAWRYAQAHKDDPETWAGDSSAPESHDDEESEADAPELLEADSDAPELPEADTGEVGAVEEAEQDAETEPEAEETQRGEEA